MEDSLHIPVMVGEVIDYLAPQKGCVYWDLTVGMGGHTKEILEASAPDGKVVAIDRDREALELAAKNLEPYGDRVDFYHGNFAEIYDLFEEKGLPLPQGILMDLGVSSLQLDEPERGFSFSQPGPLDMRMDQSQQKTAAHILKWASEKELARIIYKYGEEKKSRQIARAIVEEREKRPLKSTQDLVDIVSRIVRSRRIHPATRTFQALRIAVNEELGALERGIDQAFRLLKPGGKMVVISFHSLEDRIVKWAFRDFKKEKRGKILTKKPLTADREEVKENPRSRSAKLRAIEKIAEN